MLLTPRELEDEIGLKTRTIYNRLHTHGDLPRVTWLGKRCPRFAMEDAKAWLAEKRRAAEADAEPHTAPRRRGRPTKVEEIARREREVLALQYR